MRWCPVNSRLSKEWPSSTMGAMSSGWGTWFRMCLLMIVGVTIGRPLFANWPGADRDPHPCLYVTAKEVAGLRASLSPGELQALANKSFPDAFDALGNVDELVLAALVAGNANAEKAVANIALQAFERLLAAMPATIEKGVGPHAYARQAGVAASLADAALANKALPVDQRAKLLQSIERVNVLLHDNNYWNPKIGKCSLNPNMATSANGYRVMFAALIPSHPRAREWFDAGFTGLKREVQDWVDPNGGMVECPHYSMVILDQWVAAFVIARNAKVPDEGNLFHPNLRKAIEWFGNISTPRDSKCQNFRRLPSLGHTYANERTNMFGTMAALWRERDAVFAAEMAWMHREQGEFAEPGILSYYPGMMGFRRFFLPVGIAPRTPQWKSTVYPETGVLLRNVSGSDRETVLHLIAGRNHSHYFNDSGSITVWGKGRELCTEDDYQNRRNPDSRAAHSMPDKPATFNEERVMAVREFLAGESLDYVRGTRRGWQRQIAFAKDADPLGPNYFVVADTLDAKSVPTIWRLFLGGKIEPTPQGVTLRGPDDVDLDVMFARPAGAKPTIHGDHIQLAVSMPGTVTVVLYPRLKTEPSPSITPLADGRGVLVRNAIGSDAVFLDPESFTHQGEGWIFTGRAGLIRNRNGQRRETRIGSCEVTPGWAGGDRELRSIPWEGPQFPIFPDE